MACRHLDASSEQDRAAFGAWPAEAGGPDAAGPERTAGGGRRDGGTKSIVDAIDRR